jgi:hypothetical protein
MADKSSDLVQGTLDMLILKRWPWNRCMDMGLPSASSR